MNATARIRQLVASIKQTGEGRRSKDVNLGQALIDIGLALELVIDSAAQCEVCAGTDAPSLRICDGCAKVDKIEQERQLIKARAFDAINSIDDEVAEDTDALIDATADILLTANKALRALEEGK